MWYLAVFVPASDLAQAAAVAATVWSDDPSPAQNLAVTLVDAGGAAWVGGNTAVSDAEIAQLEGLAAIDGVRWYRYAIGDGGALALASPAGPTIGAAWGWAQSLAAAGLSRTPL